MQFKFNKMQMEDTKRNRLDLVFSKAISSSISNINAVDIDDCFGSIKSRLGNKIQMLLINKLALAEKDCEVSGIHKIARCI